MTGDDPVSLSTSPSSRRASSRLSSASVIRARTRASTSSAGSAEQELEERVESGRGAVAFAMYPTQISDVMAIADAGVTMPPKSTWFEPKLRSGLFVHRF